MTKSSPSIWHYVVSVKSTVKISSIFVTFLENMNFKQGNGNKVLSVLLKLTQYNFGLSVLNFTLFSWKSRTVRFLKFRLSTLRNSSNENFTEKDQKNSNSFFLFCFVSFWHCHIFFLSLQTSNIFKIFLVLKYPLKYYISGSLLFTHPLTGALGTDASKPTQQSKSIHAH